ncbi:MAG: beta-ketoacyl-[acyl-carrier-protein] synthase II [Gemmatimonadetes bacterium]|nr:beta-ketoacyl-[acyl-carrier-protein] synthase II [Gemmatimonadota bacterium]
MAPSERFPAARRVVVTGIGPITPAGIGVEGLWQGLQSRRSPVRRVTRFDASPFRTTIAAELDGFEALDYMERGQAARLDLYAQLAIAATRLAVADARLALDTVEPDRVTIQMGSALGGLAHGQREMIKFIQKGARAVDPRVAITSYCGAASCQVAIEFGITGPNSTNAMSCAAGTIAIGDAWRLIRSGEVDVAICGGVEAPLGPLSFGAFALIRAMSTRNDDPERACRPFDHERDGFVMGEGACILILEDEERARARGARIYAELRGFGVTNDAYHMTAPRPDGSQAAAAMRRALATGGVDASEIDYVNAHASSTPLNDATESRAIREVLGERACQIPVSGTKPYYGHALGASGAIEVGISCLALERGWIPPTLNFEKPGEGCELDYVAGEGRARRPRAVLTNSFGFGGINASLVLSQPRVEP